MRNSLFTTFTDILLLIFSFVIFVTSVLEMKETIILKQKIMNRIFQNDNLMPVDEITLSRNLCETEDGFYPIFNYTFTGVRGGSYQLDNKHFYPSKCDPLGPKYSTCIDIPNVNLQNLSIWDDKMICARRMIEGSFIIVTKNTDCPANYKLCGIYNYYKDKLCILNNQKCPLNYVNFKNKNDIDRKDMSYKYLDLNSDYVLVVSNNITNSTIPVDFKVAEYFPCLEIERLTYDPLYPIYPLISNFEKFGCNRTFYDIHVTDSGYDKRYTSLTYLKKSEFYYDNDLLQRYIELPGINNWKSDVFANTVWFMSRPYISLNFTCSSVQDYNKFKSTIENFKKMKFTLMVFALSNIFILVMFISLLSLVKIIKAWLHSILTLIKIFVSTLYITYNIVKSYHLIQFSEYVIQYIQKINVCGDIYISSGLIRYGVVSQIDYIGFLNTFIYFFSIFYGVILGLQGIRMGYKVYIRIKNRFRRKEARQQLGFHNYKKIGHTEINRKLLDNENK
jgi:hypothetical protein